ncbi:MULTISPECIES: multiple monosaccharide ABC transporter permease [unclassified Pseudobutyrivibrio]|uniref:multiple monosaccharide ABC transporter permease n=1 Tax=unclassified Pseudobutyrivibrio TaxID=2638619 RepID=UPI0008920F0F|nr:MULTISPECIES: multiple monosaccharide ABC transporter permease [unclassified Pseudobutyrivibrio]MBE5904363.1 sugar ABC transporter permease [Pseudobutyrivibrio sp.]MBR5952768.1 sugar ABC transporter permease [Pseudobutyrivibrio sp.]SCX75679.1 putative multiple sugar transport system permease protein [Pseudobutyrivibrio sp. AR14]
MEKKRVNLDMKQYGMFIALIVIYLIFAALTGGKNLTPMNINNLVMQNGYVVILAIGMLLCVLTGNVDLGVGSVVALCGASAGIVMMDYKMNMWVAIIAALAIGLLVGMFAGFFIAYLSIPPFVVTLATMLMGRGLTYTLLQAQTKGPLPANYNFIGAGFLPTYKIFFGDGILDLVSIFVAIIASVALVWTELKSIKTKKKYNFALAPTWQTVLKLGIELFIIWFFFYKLARYNGLPFVLLIMVILIGIYAFVTTKTVAGRQIYALGGNRKAANLSGIDTNKVFFWVYTNMGVLSAIAGIVLSARNGSSTPKAGDGFEMDAIASCYIGGAAVAGGSGTILGAVIGAFVMGILNNGMSLFGWSTDIQKIVKGAVLLGAVTVDVLSKRKKN